MKKVAYFAAVAAVMVGCSSKSDFTLKGQFQNFEGDMVWLISSGEAIDSVASADGSFSFKGKVSLPTIAYVANARTSRGASKRCMFILEPGNMTMDKMKIEGEHYSVVGTTSNYLLMNHDSEEHMLEEYYEINKNMEGIDEQVEERYNNLLLKGVEHTDILYGLYCLNDLSYSQDPVKTQEMLETFTPYMKKTKLWNDINERNIKMLATVPGKHYMEFSQADPDGKIIASKDVLANPANKYLLIDFWASWCGPCMQEVPYLTETYAKYKDKGFQILGVSLDLKRENWLGAIEKHGMNWIHVSDLKYWENEVARQYGVNSIPSNFLVECSTGTIIATGLRGKNLEKKIEELLK